MNHSSRSLFSSVNGNIPSETIERNRVRDLIDNLDEPEGIDVIPSANIIRPKIPGSVVLTRDNSDISPEELKERDRARRNIETLRKRQELNRELGFDDSKIPSLRTDPNDIDKLIENEQNHIDSITSITISGLDIIVEENTSQVKNNPLDHYTSVQYHISLTMMSQDATIDFQTKDVNYKGDKINIDTLKKEQRIDQSVTIASTGEVFRNESVNDPSSPSSVLNPRNYYNILSMTTKNVMEPSLMNPMVSNMLSIKLRIAEPYGFKLDEDIRNLACSLGYENINLGRIHYRVDLYFSGYDQDTGAWIEQIDISAGKGINIISNVMNISKFDAEITATGTIYNIDMAPAGHFAYRVEDFVFGALSKYSGTTFRDFLTNLSTVLHKDKFERTQKRIIRNYEFFAPEALMDAQFDIEEFQNQHRALFRGADKDQISATGKDIDILTILRGAIASTPFGRDLFIADTNNERFTTPRIHFTIRFHSIFGDSTGKTSIDVGLHDYKEITHQYIIEPYITFKQGTVTEETMEQYVAPESQLARIKEMIRFGMLRRIYNYLYTSENTEVIDFSVKLRAFYFEALNTTAQDQASGQQAFVGSASEAQIQQVKTNELFQVLGDAGSDENVDNAVRRLFGDLRTDTAIGESGKVRRGASRLGGGFNETPDSRFFGTVTSPSEGRRSDYETYLNDYLSEDLLKLNGMQVRGDPVWLLGPYGNVDINSLGNISFDRAGRPKATLGTSRLQVRPRTGQVIFLKLFPPVQDDYMNPNRSHGSSHPNIIGGFYQIWTVVSTFDNGKFTQALDGSKMAHLNYAEELFERSAANRRLGGPITRLGDIHREPIQDNATTGTTTPPDTTDDGLGNAEIA